MPFFYKAKVLIRILVDRFYIPVLDQKYSEANLEAKLHKITHSIFKVIYFTLISIFGY